MRSRPWPLLGPAFVASIAYVDPGNVATNVAAGSSYGYTLVWVVVGATLLASLLQYLAAKLGIATGMSLAEVVHRSYARGVTRVLAVQAVAMMLATDLAEVLGGAIALHILFAVPLPLGGVITGMGSLALLMIRSARQRRFEVVMLVVLMVMLTGFLTGTVAAPPPAGALAHGLVPSIPDTQALVLAVGMLGATVMPHAIYLHSALVPDRFPERPGSGEDKTRLLSATRMDIVLAMLLAGTVNVAMVLLAAGALGGTGIASIEAAHTALAAAVGGSVAFCFALVLLVSGVASSAVGTYAGSVVFDGFSRRQWSLVSRRLLTLVPAVAMLFGGIGATQLLILSQVVLSFGIPATVIPLVAITSKREVMGDLVNRQLTRLCGVTVAALITALNAALLALTVLS